MYQDSPYSALYSQEDYDMEDENDDYLEDDRDLDDQYESDEGKGLACSFYNYHLISIVISF